MIFVSKDGITWVSGVSSLDTSNWNTRHRSTGAWAKKDAFGGNLHCDFFERFHIEENGFEENTVAIRVFASTIEIHINEILFLRINPYKTFFFNSKFEVSEDPKDLIEAKDQGAQWNNDFEGEIV